MRRVAAVRVLARHGRRRWLGLLALLVVALLACASDEQKLEGHLERAASLREEGKPREALIELRSALQIDPQSARINLELAQLLEGQGRHADALFFYEEALRLEPTHEEAALGVVRLRSFEDAERAREVMEALLERSPDSAPARIQSSALALVERDLERAWQDAVRATELAPKNAAAWFQRGRAGQARVQIHQSEQREPDEELLAATRQAFEEVIRLVESGEDEAEPLARAARVEVARVLAAWPGHQEEADRAYRAALDEAEAAGDPERLRTTALAMERFGRQAGLPEVRREALERLVAAQPERVGAWRRLASLAAARGDDVSQVYTRMLEAAPAASGVQIEYARFLQRSQGAEAARAHLREALGEVDDPVAVLGSLVEMQLASGDVEAAAESVAQMRERAAEDPRTRLAEGSLALHEGRVDEAVRILRDAVSVHERPDLYLVLGTALLRQGSLEEALQAADRALELYPGYSREAARLRIDILRRRGDWEAVSQAFAGMLQRRIRLSPAEQEVLAGALYRTGRRTAARRVLDAMLRGEEPRPGAVLMFLRWEGDREPARARQLAEAALARHPTHLPLLGSLVDLELRQAEPERALAHLEQAVAAGQDDPRVDLLRARTLAGLSRVDQALAAARKAFEAMPESAEAMDLLVSLYLASGRTDEAIRSFQQADAAGTLDAEGKVLLGRLLLEAGRPDAARQALEAALAAGSGSALARNDLAFLLADAEQDLERALSLALEAKEARPEDPVVADTLGFVLLKRGLAGPAEARFREALRLAEERGEARPGYHYRLGLALQAQGRPGEAATAFEQALELDAGFPEAAAARSALEAARAEAGNAS